jgi:hypothetical protein
MKKTEGRKSRDTVPLRESKRERKEEKSKKENLYCFFAIASKIFFSN